jgi:hypothetical protein
MVLNDKYHSVSPPKSQPISNLSFSDLSCISISPKYTTTDPKMWFRICLYLSLLCVALSFGVLPLKYGKLHHLSLSRVGSWPHHHGTRLMAKKGGDSVSRRRNRRKKEDSGDKSDTKQSTVVSTDPAKVAAAAARSMPPPNDALKAAGANLIQREGDGTSSLEDVFGLGDNQLKELMETELPVPREDLVTKREVQNADENKVFKLPDLNEFLDSEKDEKTKREEATAVDAAPRIDRNNQEEYLRVMQLNPFADADESMFTEEYDIIPSIFGSGKLLGIPVPYLQTGHGILLLVCLLAGFIYAPGNPLTEFPVEIRTFLKSGLGVVYSINTVLAVQAFFVAKGKNLPGIFWAIKTFLLGGVAYFEIRSAVDPTKKGANADARPYLSDRKSRSRK